MQLPESIARDIVQKLLDRFNPQRIILFGSYARGTATPDSDIDLMVVMKFEGSKRAKRIEIRKALRNLGKPKDVVLVSPEEFDQLKDIVGTIVYPVAREGVMLYGAAA